MDRFREQPRGLNVNNGITAQLEDYPRCSPIGGNTRQKVVNFPRVIIRLRGFAAFPPLLSSLVNSRAMRRNALRQFNGPIREASLSCRVAIEYRGGT